MRKGIGSVLAAILLLGFAASAWAIAGPGTNATTVTTTSTIILAGNDIGGGRHYLEVCNAGVQVMWLNFCNASTGCTATVNGGTPLAPGACWNPAIGAPGNQYSATVFNGELEAITETNANWVGTTSTKAVVTDY